MSRILTTDALSLMNWKRHQRHFEEHEFESDINLRQTERFIMTSEGGISGKASWVRVSMYLMRLYTSTGKQYFTNKTLIFTEKL